VLLNLVEALAFAGRAEEATAMLPDVEQVMDAGFVLGWASIIPTSTAAGIAAACARNWPLAEKHHKPLLPHSRIGSRSLRATSRAKPFVQRVTTATLYPRYIYRNFTGISK